MSLLGKIGTWGTTGIQIAAQKVTRAVIGGVMTVAAGVAAVFPKGGPIAESIIQARDNYWGEGNNTDTKLIQNVKTSQAKQDAQNRAIKSEEKITRTTDITKIKGEHHEKMAKKNENLTQVAEKTTEAANKSTEQAKKATEAVTTLTKATKDVNNAYAALHGAIRKNEIVNVTADAAEEKASVIHKAMLNAIKAEEALKTEQAVGKIKGDSAQAQAVTKAGIAEDKLATKQALQHIKETSAHSQALADTFAKLPLASVDLLKQLDKQNDQQLAQQKSALSITPAGPQKEQAQELIQKLESFSTNIKTMIVTKEEEEKTNALLNSMPEAPTGPIKISRKETNHNEENSHVSCVK